MHTLCMCLTEFQAAFYLKRKQPKLGPLGSLYFVLSPPPPLPYIPHALNIVIQYMDWIWMFSKLLAIIDL